MIISTECYIELNSEIQLSQMSLWEDLHIHTELELGPGTPKNLLHLHEIWRVYFFTEKYAKQVIQYNFSPGQSWKELQEFLLNSR